MSLNMQSYPGLEADDRETASQPKGHLPGYSGHIPGMKDFGDGVSYNKYTAAYMDAKEGGAGDFQKTIPFKNAECGAVSDVHKPVSTLKTLPPGYNSLPSVKQATMGDDMGDHTALSVKHGHSNVFTSEDDETMYTRTMANLEKTRKLRNSMPMGGYTGCLP